METLWASGDRRKTLAEAACKYIPVPLGLLGGRVHGAEVVALAILGHQDRHELVLRLGAARVHGAVGRLVAHFLGHGRARRTLDILPGRFRNRRVLILVCPTLFALRGGLIGRSLLVQRVLAARAERRSCHGVVQHPR